MATAALDNSLSRGKCFNKALGVTRSSNASKLERLNCRVVKLLTAAVQEVLEAVRETVSEYQEKTARTQRENERLRLKLQDALKKLEQEREVSRLASVSVSVTRPHADSQQTIGAQRASRSKQDSVVKADAEAEAEAVCDLQVALTLPDTPPARPEQIDTADSDKGAKSGARVSDASSRLDIKTEPFECFQQQHEEQELQQEQLPLVVTMAEGLRDQTTVQDISSSVYVQPNLDVLGSCTGTSWSAASSLHRLTWTSQHHGPHDEEHHACQVCGKTFSRVGNLRIHQRCHTGEKPYRCLVCGRCFSQAGDLKKHKRVHTGEKPYCCLQCGKSFSRGENLKRHQKIHAGDGLQRAGLWKDSNGLAM